MSSPAHSRSDKNMSVTTENDTNNLSLCGDQSDKPFAAPAFHGRDDNIRRGGGGGGAYDHDDGDMPSMLANSRSNVPGMTAAELMAAHRHSIAVMAGGDERDMDMHSITLSRHQVQPEDMYPAEMSGMPDEEFHECLNSFKFGDQSEEKVSSSIHANS